MKIELRKKVVYKEQEYTCLDLNLDGLSGLDLMKANAKLDKTGIDEMMPVLSLKYQVLVAAAAAKVPHEVIEQLCAKDFILVTVETQSFLLDTGSKKKAQKL